MKRATGNAVSVLGVAAIALAWYVFRYAMTPNPILAAFFLVVSGPFLILVGQMVPKR